MEKLQTKYLENFELTRKILIYIFEVKYLHVCMSVSVKFKEFMQILGNLSFSSGVCLGLFNKK